MAKGLAAAGASVVIAGRNKAKAKAALAEIAALGGKAEFAELDVLQEASCKQAIDGAAERFGRLDILVNNAGTSIRKPPQDLTRADWHQVMDTNLTSRLPVRAGGLSAHDEGRRRQDHQYRLDDVDVRARPMRRLMRRAKAASCRWRARWPSPGRRTTSRSTSILPGWIDTELTRTAREQVPGLHDKVLARTPAQRWGEPEDFAGIAVFLASPASDFITGAAIAVDGGYSVQA